MAKNQIKAATPSDKQELEWRAESDVRTLAEAAKIRADKARFNRAKAKAQEQLKALTQSVKAME